MTKRKIGDFLNIYPLGPDDDFPLYFYGHATEEILRKQEEITEQFGNDEFQIEHGWGRLVPSNDGMFEMLFFECKKGRGAMPITIVRK